VKEVIDIPVGIPRGYISEGFWWIRHHRVRRSTETRCLALQIELAIDSWKNKDTLYL